MISSRLKAIIQLTGQPGAGKTTLANLLGEELAPASILFIDASPDRKLTYMLSPQPPLLTLETLLQQWRETTASGPKEAIDWAFHDLTVSVGDENELMTLGKLNEEIGIAAQEKLRYGLNRLIENYDYVVIDGYYPLLQLLLPDEGVRILDVVTPEDFIQWQPVIKDVLHTPALLLNRYSEESLPSSMEEALTNREVQLIGKLPHYTNPDDCIHKLPEDFKNCLLKLNIPFNLNPS